MPHVTIYTSPICGFCKMAKEFLAEKSIAYDEKNVTTDEVALKKLTDEYKAQGVPLIVIENNGSEEVIHGFDAPKLKASLALN